MRTIELLFNSDVVYVRHAFAAAAAVGLVCSLMSVVVVLKRMAFIGQGVSHAGFGGYGLALFLGMAGFSQQLVMAGFCLATAVGIGYLVRRRKVEPDSAIGILMVAGMAAGVIFQNLRVAMQGNEWYRSTFGAPTFSVSWEQLLFGSPWTVGAGGMWAAIIMAAAIIGVGAALYKEMIFFAFDETAAQVFGVRTGFMYYLLLIMLGLVVVVAMRLVGFILVSALLVMPGATALQLSQRIGGVLALAAGVGVVGSLAGLVISVEIADLSPGAAIVAVLTVLFLGAAGLRRVIGE